MFLGNNHCLLSFSPYFWLIWKFSTYFLPCVLFHWCISYQFRSVFELSQFSLPLWALPHTNMSHTLRKRFFHSPLQPQMQIHSQSQFQSQVYVCRAGGAYLTLSYNTLLSGSVRLGCLWPAPCQCGASYFKNYSNKCMSCCFCCLCPFCVCFAFCFLWFSLFMCCLSLSYA